MVQAVEYQHGLEVQPDQPMHCSVTVQTLFRQYPKLAGMTVRPACCCAVHAHVHMLLRSASAMQTWTRLKFHNAGTR